MCAANGVHELVMCFNKTEEAYAVSEGALLEFCFTPGGPSRMLELDNLTTTSDKFAAKFLEVCFERRFRLFSTAESSVVVCNSSVFCLL